MGRHRVPRPGMDLDGRDELNLVEFPLATLSEQIPKGITKIQFSDRFTDRVTRVTIERKVTLTTHSDFGMTTATDELVLVALIQLTREHNNFTDPVVPFSRYRLLQIMGWEDQTRNYLRLKQAMLRWASLLIVYENAWWNLKTKTFDTVAFHIIDNLELSDVPRLVGGEKPHFRWNQVPFASLQAGNLRALDLDMYYRKLTIPLSRRLYRYLGKKFHHEKFRHELEYLAFEKLGMSRNYDVHKIKERMLPALLELEQTGFIKPAPKSERFFKVLATWHVVIQPGKLDAMTQGSFLDLGK